MGLPSRFGIRFRFWLRWRTVLTYASFRVRAWTNVKAEVRASTKVKVGARAWTRVKVAVRDWARFALALVLMLVVVQDKVL